MLKTTVTMADASLLTVEPLEQGVFHFQLLTGRNEEYSQPLLTKYRILRTDWPDFPAAVSDCPGMPVQIEAGDCVVKIQRDTGEISALGSSRPLSLQFSGRLGAAYRDRGFRLDFTLDDQERLYGWEMRHGKC